MIFIFSCDRKGCTDPSATNFDSEAVKYDGSCIYPNIIDIPPVDSSTSVLGFNILEKLPGIWDGPVTSPTSLGSFPVWIVDFRPISSSQISAKNELDSINDIFMSFFICKLENTYKIAFRNGGGFAGQVRNSYMVIDSLSENSSHSFYRFVDPISGGNRVYTDITFKGDSMIMHTFTNQYGSLVEPVTHMRWTADLMDETSAQDAIIKFDYPKKEMTKDFSSTFEGLSDAVFYNNSSDPYPENEQPYLGNTNVNVNITNPTSIDVNRKVLIFITTKPLFNGFSLITTNLDTRSRYVLVGAANPTGYNFNYMHPGDYYLNAIYDSNGDQNFTSGDYMNSNLDIPFTLTDKGSISTNVTIDFQIP
jgi:hypothetical protein